MVAHSVVVITTPSMGYRPDYGVRERPCTG
jgi:hypothetical protein